jgi:hypothetical protein
LLPVIKHGNQQIPFEQLISVRVHLQLHSNDCDLLWVVVLHAQPSNLKAAVVYEAIVSTPQQAFPEAGYSGASEYTNEYAQPSQMIYTSL